MKGEQCPICYSELEVIECAPCDDCGHQKEEIKHFEDGVHTYNVYDVYKGLKLQLCNLCSMDFASYKSEYLGFTDNQRIGFYDFEFISSVENSTKEKDKYCPECQQRLKFLTFLRDLRELIKDENIDTNKT